MCLDDLRSSPNLLGLGILCETWFIEDASLSDSMPMICLNRLQMLSLVLGVHEEDPGLDAVFDHLETPKLRHLSLTYDVNHKWITSPSCLSFMWCSLYSLVCLHLSVVGEVDEFDEGPDVVQCLQVLPRILPSR